MNSDKVKSEFQLLATSVKTIDFINNFTYFDANDAIERKFDVSYEFDDISYDEENETTLGTITLTVNASVKDKESEMRFNFTMQGCFISETEISMDDFKKMLEVNGCATLYSIARAIILNISSQACYGAHVLLPMINLFKLRDATKQEINPD